MLEAGHNIDPQTTFTIISRQTKPQLPSIAEAVAIQNYTPDFMHTKVICCWLTSTMGINPVIIIRSSY